MASQISIKAGDTEPLTITVSATGLSDLTGVTTAVFYAIKDGEATNHVDGATLTIPDTSALAVVFDPVDAKNGGGNAFDERGKYRCEVKLTMSDGDVSRFPGSGVLYVNVGGALG